LRLNTPVGSPKPANPRDVGSASALYAKAAAQKARQFYNASADTYYKANDAAAYDDWVRARNHWDYFYNRKFVNCPL
jgi:hypothetical protein